MKKWFNIAGLLPAVVVGVVAAYGLQTTVPTLTKVVWPEKPEIKVEAKEKTDKKATPVKYEKTETEKGVGNYTDGTFTGEGVGYGGKTTVSVTVESKQITSVDVLSNNDTPSFFNKAKDTVISEILTAQTWEVDSVSGATYSSRGIKEAVCNAITGQVSQSAEPEKAKAPTLAATQAFTMGALKDGVFTGSAKGFGGSIKVSVTISGGKITAIKVLSHSGETSSYYKKATAIIGRILKAQTPNVDTVSGATYSSTGIREAVKNALKKASGKKVVEKVVAKTPTKKQPEVKIPDGTPADGTYIGTANCTQSGRFNYNVTVYATYKDGKLVNLTYTTTDSGENATYIKRAWNGLKDELLGDQTGNVDVVSRATYTSNAIKTAYRLAYKQAVEANGGKVDETDATTETPQDTTATTPSTEAGDDTATATDKVPSVTGATSTIPDIKGVPADGSYKVSVKVNSYDTDKASQAGWFENYTLSGTVIFKDGKLTSIAGLTIGSEPDEYEYEDDQYYLDKAKNTVIASLISKQSSDVDTVSGATCSSKGIIRLYEAALKEAVEKNDANTADATTATTATTATATTATTATSDTAKSTTTSLDSAKATTATTEATEATTATTESEKTDKDTTEADKDKKDSTEATTEKKKDSTEATTEKKDTSESEKKKDSTEATTEKKKDTTESDKKKSSESTTEKKKDTSESEKKKSSESTTEKKSAETKKESTSTAEK